MLEYFRLKTILKLIFDRVRNINIHIKIVYKERKKQRTNINIKILLFKDNIIKS